MPEMIGKTASLECDALYDEVCVSFMLQFEKQGAVEKPEQSSVLRRSVLFPAVIMSEPGQSR